MSVAIVSFYSILQLNIYIYKFFARTPSRILRAKNLQATLLFVDFTKAFDSIHRGKMEQILLAYSLPKETVAAITILYRNTKVKVRSPDGDTEYFDIVAGVLQGDTLAPYLFIICLDYVLRTSIDKIRENGFELTKKRSRRYPAKTITDADYAMTQRYWQIHPTKLKHYCIVWNEQPQAQASMSMHTKRNICAIIKQVTYPHQMETLLNQLTNSLTQQAASHRPVNEGMDSYQQAIDHMEIRPNR